MCFSRNDVDLLIKRRAKLCHYWQDPGPYVESLPADATVAFMDLVLEQGSVSDISGFLTYSAMIDGPINYDNESYILESRDSVLALLDANPNVTAVEADTPTPTPAASMRTYSIPSRNNTPSSGCYAFFLRCFSCCSRPDSAERALLVD